MENTPWKPIFIATGASLVLLFLVYIIVLPKTAPHEKVEGKIASFKSARVSGREKGKKAWEFYAQSGWTEKDANVTHLENVSRGSLYKEGSLITKNLTAPEVRTFRSSKVVEAFGSGKKQLSAQIAFVKEGKKRKFAFMRSDRLKYEPDIKKTTLNGNIIINEKDVKIKTSRVMIDHEKETADLADKVQIDRKDLFLTCSGLYYDAKEEKFDARGRINSRIKAKQRTSLNSDRMTFYIDSKKDVEAFGSIEAAQGKKSAVSEHALYNKPAHKISLSRNVKAVIEKGRAILKEGSIKKLSNPDAKKLLEEKTFITSDNLDLSTKNGDARAAGNVTVYQKNREAKANLADYSDKTEIITLKDNVYLKREKGWVKCQKVEVSVKNETFTAYGSVEAEFRIKK